MLPLLFTLLILVHLVHLGQPQPSIKSVCFEEPETGSCRAYLPSFYFNVQTGSCDCFVFGGCAPGGNNFESMEMCMTTCGKNQATQVMSRDCRRILTSINVARPIESSQNEGTSSGGSRPPVPPTDLSQTSGSSSQVTGSDQRPSTGDSSVSVSSKHPDFNETTVQQLQTIFNEISASGKPSSTQEAINHLQDPNQREPNQQRVPTSGTTATRPVFPPPSPVRPPPVSQPPVRQPPVSQAPVRQPPVRQTTQREKDFILSKTKGDQQRPETNPRTNPALQRQIEQQKELERQLQETIQQHQQLQRQQQQQQQEQLLQQQAQQRQQQQQQRRKQQGTSG